MLMGEGAEVYVIAAGESWPVKQVKSVLKEGWEFGAMRPLPPHFRQRAG
jgi:hypothetical protein